MTYTFSNELYSDLHKDAYGFRPSAYNYAQWAKATDDEKQLEWDRLVKLMEDNTSEEQTRQEKAMQRFEQKIASYLDSTTLTRKEVVQMLYDAMEPWLLS